MALHLDRIGRRMGTLLLAATTLAAAGPGLAQDTELSPEYVAAVSAILDKAIAEQTVFLNCTATSPSQFGKMVSSWMESAVETGTLLFEIGFDVAYVSDFADRASLTQIMMYDQTFLAVTSFCNSEANWEQKFFGLDYTLLPMAIDNLEMPEIVPPDDGKTLTPGKLDNGL